MTFVANTLSKTKDDLEYNRIRSLYETPMGRIVA